MPEIEEVTSGEWIYKGRTEHEIQCHVQDLPENGSDLAHLNYLHLAGVNKGNSTQQVIANVVAGLTYVVCCKDAHRPLLRY